jgi:putative membrane protein
MADPLDEDDEGLAPERTALAWSRTALAFFVAIAALGRRVWPIGESYHGVAVAVIGAAALAFVASLLLAGRIRTHHRYDGETMDPRAFPLVTGGTVALAVAAFALALVP